MPTRTGTLTLADLLAIRYQNAAQYGLDTIAEVIQADLNVHNNLVEDMLGELVSTTDDKQRVAGTSVDGEMLEADEFSRVPTQRVVPGQTVGFPLRKFQYAIGWTRAFAKRRTPRDFAIQTQAAEKAHLRRIRYEIQRAIYIPTNYNFVDKHDSGLTLAVKAFINADSSGLPQGPNGEVFDGATHTHYDGSATLTAAAVLALIRDIVEHGNGNQVRVVINQANEAAFTALTGFVAYPDPRLRMADNVNVPNRTVDITKTDNRPIGIFGSAEVWVKPWAIANYAFAYDSGSDAKPLVFRNGPGEDGRGLRIEAQLETFPLYAQYMEALFGLGVWNRTNGAVLKFDNATYAAPTFVL